MSYSMDKLQILWPTDLHRQRSWGEHACQLHWEPRACDIFAWPCCYANRAQCWSRVGQ